MRTLRPKGEVGVERSTKFSLMEAVERLFVFFGLHAGVRDHLRPLLRLAVDDSRGSAPACRQPELRPGSPVSRSTVGSFIASTAALLSTATTCGGVLAGATMPYQFSVCRWAMPTSTVVGTSGALATRSVAPTAIGLSLPALICGSRHRQIEEHHLHLLGQQVVHGRRRATVGHVHDVDAGGELEQFASKVRQCCRDRTTRS